MGEAARPFLNPDSVLVCSGQLCSCSWCVLHPARLSLAACLTHYSQWRRTYTHFHTGLLLWFCLTRLSHSSQTAVPPCCSPVEQRSCHYACKNLNCVASKDECFWSHGFKFCLEAIPPHQEQTRLYTRPTFETSGFMSIVHLTLVFRPDQADWLCKITVDSAAALWFACCLFR